MVDMPLRLTYSSDDSLPAAGYYLARSLYERSFYG